jgi:hypothetical protein
MHQSGSFASQNNLNGLSRSREYILNKKNFNYNLQKVNNQVSQILGLYLIR